MSTHHPTPGDRTVETSSFRDPSGFLYHSGGVLYRQVNQSYQEDYDHLIDSGLYQRLVEQNLLIPHQEAAVEPAEANLAYKVIQPEVVPFISYPYEWCFSQLKGAALATLKIQKMALECGMSLKDSSAYNIQFHQGRPCLIDTLSFEIYQEGRPWTAYRQFCQHFLAPLSLMAYRDVHLGQLLRVHIDGIPLETASKLLPLQSRFSLPLLLHIHVHAASQRRYADRSVDTSRQVSRTSFLGLLDSLETGTRALKWSPSGTEWSGYYQDHNYSEAGLIHKKDLVREFLETIRPQTVWDLGANTGFFSRLASDQDIPTLAFDVDPGAVEKNYQDCRARKEKHLLPLLMDLTNPSPSLGWHNQERRSLLERGPAHTLLALALVHHLAISNNVPLGWLAPFFQDLGEWLVIEFIPKTDSQVQKLLSTRKDIFADYTVEHFERAFSPFFTIHRREAIRDSERILYLMERKH